MSYGLKVLFFVVYVLYINDHLIYLLSYLNYGRVIESSF